MNDIDHLLTLCPPHFPSTLSYCKCICRGENVVNMAASYSGQHNRLTLFAMYASVCFSPRSVEEKATQFIMNSEYNCSNAEPKLC